MNSAHLNTQIAANVLSWLGGACTQFEMQTVLTLPMLLCTDGVKTATYEHDSFSLQQTAAPSSARSPRGGAQDALLHGLHLHVAVVVEPAEPRSDRRGCQ